MVLIAKPTKIMSKIIDEQDTPTDTQVLTFASASDSWEASDSGGGGEDNTSSNSGTGDGWALAKVGVDLPFKSVITTAPITTTVNANDLTLVLNALVNADLATGIFAAITGIGTQAQTLNLNGNNIDNVAAYFSNATNPAIGQTINLGTSERLAWRNVANSSNNYIVFDDEIFSIGPGNSNQYRFDSTQSNWVSNNMINMGTLNTHTIPGGTSTFVLTSGAQTLGSKTLDSTNIIQAGAYAADSIVNADINATAAIVESKFDVAVGVASTVLTSNGVGSAPTYQTAAGGEFTGAWTADHNQSGTGFSLRDARFSDVTDSTKELFMDLSGNGTGIVLTVAPTQSTNQTLTIPNLTGVATAFVTPALQDLQMAANAIDFNTDGHTITPSATALIINASLTSDVLDFSTGTTRRIQINGSTDVRVDLPLRIRDTADLTKTFVINPAGLNTGIDITLAFASTTVDRTLTVPLLTGNRNILVSGEAQIVTGDLSATAGIVSGQINDLATTKLTGILPDARMPDLTGDVTTSEGAVATTVVNVPSGAYAAGSIDNDDINASAAIVQSKLAALVVGDLPDGTAFQRYRTDTAGTAIENFTEEAGIVWVIDGGGSVITTGTKGGLEIPFACTINRMTLLADQTGSIQVDIWKDTFANYPPTDADSITSAAVPAISSSDKDEDSTLTGWTTQINAGDILYYNVDSVTTIERVTITLSVNKEG